MSNDKRSVHTDALATLGTIIDDKQKRDAIHLAVEPVIAGQDLAPGDHVIIEDGYAIRTEEGKGLGIVDPFLTAYVNSGERFWFVMYPRTITSLRHVWSHPAFKDEAGTTATEKTNVEVSIAWLRRYAATWNSYYVDGTYGDSVDAAYEKLMEEIAGGDSLTYYGNDMHGLGDLQDANELRKHASIVLGRDVDWSKFDYFSCTC